MFWVQFLITIFTSLPATGGQQLGQQVSQSSSSSVFITMQVSKIYATVEENVVKAKHRFTNDIILFLLQEQNCIQKSKRETRTNYTQHGPKTSGRTLSQSTDAMSHQHQYQPRLKSPTTV